MYYHFLKLQEIKPTDGNIFVTLIRDLKIDFLSRLPDHSHTSDCRLLPTPFDVEVDAVPENVQMELIEMQRSDLSIQDLV